MNERDLGEIGVNKNTPFLRTHDRESSFNPLSSIKAYPLSPDALRCNIGHLFRHDH